MEDYSDEILEEIKDTVECWSDSFANTKMFKNLSEAAQDNAFFITSLFADYMYNYFLQEPKDWTADALEEVIGDLFPQKITAESDLFKAVEPVLTAFFQYLGDNGNIENSGNLIKMLKKTAPIMLKQSNDSASWGPAKQFAMDALNFGVDLEDQQSLNDFMHSFNERNMLFEANSKPNVGRYDPCPCGSGKKFKFCCEKKYKR